MVKIYDHRGDLYQRSTDAREIARIFRRQDAYSYGASLTRNSWLYAAITDIATSLSQVPFSLYAPKRGAGSRYTKSLWVEVDNHPLVPLLESPNELQSMQRFIMQWATYMLMTGNAFIYLGNKNSFNVPASMEVYGQFQVSPVRRSSQDPPMAWEITFDSARQRVQVPLEDVVHCMMPNDSDQYIGIPPWLAVSLQMDADNARIIYDKYFFRNNATPDSVLTYKNGPLNEATKQSILESWNDSYSGPESAGSIAVIGGDFDLKVLGVPHSAAQYIDSRQFTREEIASVYHYPVQLLNKFEGTGLGRDMLTVARKIKYENAVIPLGAMLESEFTRKVVRKVVSRKKVSAFFDYDGLPINTDDMLDKARTLKVLVESGVPINAGISKLDLGMEPIEGGDIPREYKPAIAKQSILDDNGEDNNIDDTKEKDDIEDDSIMDQEKKRIQQNAEAKLLDVQDVIQYASRKIKRILYDLRSEYYRHLDNINFDRRYYYTAWKDKLTKPLYFTYLVACNDLDKDQISIDIRNKQFQEKIPKAIIDQIERSTSIIDSVHDDITTYISEGIDIEKSVKASFEDINKVAHSLATEQVIWAMNQGVLDSGKEFVVHRLREECRATHDSLATGEIGKCWCILI